MDVAIGAVNSVQIQAVRGVIIGHLREVVAVIVIENRYAVQFQHRGASTGSRIQPVKGRNLAGGIATRAVQYAVLVNRQRSDRSVQLSNIRCLAGGQVDADQGCRVIYPLVDIDVICRVLLRHAIHGACGIIEGHIHDLLPGVAQNLVIIDFCCIDPVEIIVGIIPVVIAVEIFAGTNAVHIDHALARRSQRGIGIRQLNPEVEISGSTGIRRQEGLERTAGSQYGNLNGVGKLGAVPVGEGDGNGRRTGGACCYHAKVVHSGHFGVGAGPGLSLNRGPSRLGGRPQRQGTAGHDGSRLAVGQPHVLHRNELGLRLILGNGEHNGLFHAGFAGHIADVDDVGLHLAPIHHIQGHQVQGVVALTHAGIPVDVARVVVVMHGSIVPVLRTGRADLIAEQGLRIHDEEIAVHAGAENGGLVALADYGHSRHHIIAGLRIVNLIELELAQGINGAGLQIHNTQAAVGEVDTVHSAGVVVEAQAAHFNAFGVADQLGRADDRIRGSIHLGLVHEAAGMGGILNRPGQLANRIHIAVPVGAALPCGRAGHAVGGRDLRLRQLRHVIGGQVAVGDPLILVALVDIIRNDVAVNLILRRNNRDLAGGSALLHAAGIRIVYRSCGRDCRLTGANSSDIAGRRNRHHILVAAGPGHFVLLGVPGRPGQVDPLPLANDHGRLIGIQSEGFRLHLAVRKYVGGLVRGHKQRSRAADTLATHVLYITGLRINPVDSGDVIAAGGTVNLAVGIPVNAIRLIIVAHRLNHVRANAAGLGIEVIQGEQLSTLSGLLIHRIEVAVGGNAVEIAVVVTSQRQHLRIGIQTAQGEQLRDAQLLVVHVTGNHIQAIGACVCTGGIGLAGIGPAHSVKGVLCLGINVLILEQLAHLTAALSVIHGHIIQGDKTGITLSAGRRRNLLRTPITPVRRQQH